MTNYLHKSYLDNFTASKLIKFDIELTERCNNNCVHCCINLPANDIDALNLEMSLSDIKGILNEAANLGCLTVRLTGGEPLLRPDFEDIYLYARQLGMGVLLYTNACLITNRLAELFSKIPLLQAIQVTVYGMHQESYESNTRVPGSFMQFQKGLHLLEKFQIPFIVKSVLLPANKDEKDEFESWAAQIPWMKEKPYYSVFLDLRNRRDDEKKNDLIRSLRIDPESGAKLMLSYYSDIESYRDMFIRSKDRKTGNHLFTCDAGEKQLCVDAYGMIQPCMGLRIPELVLPKGTPLESALERYKELKKLTTENPEYLSRCGQCVLRNLCEQCPAKSWAETGKMDVPVEYLCEAAHAQARSLGLISIRKMGWEII